MEAAWSCKVLVSTHHNTWHYNPENHEFLVFIVFFILLCHIFIFISPVNIYVYLQYSKRLFTSYVNMYTEFTLAWFNSVPC